jgi:hypothetical protein
MDVEDVGVADAWRAPDRSDSLRIGASMCL